ncbi:hypothetical protein B0H13DRAFT_1880340 [Mycena leptocephala]|nr:hypothetical protein B0H13DRAFT_1880340 [Mycena leptocephala]
MTRVCAPPAHALFFLVLLLGPSRISRFLNCNIPLIRGSKSMAAPDGPCFGLVLVCAEAVSPAYFPRLLLEWCSRQPPTSRSSPIIMDTRPCATADSDSNAFESDRRDYAPLWPNFDDIENQIGKFSSTDYMRDNMAPLLGVSNPARTNQGNASAPTARLTVRRKGFEVPGDIEALAAHLGDSRVSRHTVSGQDVEILDDYAGSMWILDTHSDILTKLKVVHDRPAGGILTTKTTLAALDVFGDGSHQLSTTVNNNRHLVTIFIILPLVTAPGKLRMHITYETASEHQDISVRGGAIGLYTGVSESGARFDVARAGQVICLTYHTFVVCSYGPFRVPKFQYLFGGFSHAREGLILAAIPNQRSAAEVYNSLHSRV